MEEDKNEQYESNGSESAHHKTYPRRQRKKPQRYGFEDLSGKSISTLNMDQESLSNMMESLKESEMEETNEMELIRGKMEELEKRSRERREMLEHISTLLGQSTNQPQAQDEPQLETQEEAPSHDSHLPTFSTVNYPAVPKPPPPIDAHRANPVLQSSAFIQATLSHEPLRLHDELRGAVGGFEPPGGALLDHLKEVLNEPMYQGVPLLPNNPENDSDDSDSNQSIFLHGPNTKHNVNAEVQYDDIRPHAQLVGTSTPHLNPDQASDAAVRPQVQQRNIQQFTLTGHMDSAEENFTAYRLHNLPLSTVKMPVVPPAFPYKPLASTQGLNIQPTLQHGLCAKLTNCVSQQQRLPLQYQVIRSQPILSSLGPVCSQPLSLSNQQRPQPSTAPPAGEAMPATSHSFHSFHPRAPGNQCIVPTHSHPQFLPYAGVQSQPLSSQQVARISLPPPSEMAHLTATASANPLPHEPSLYGVPRPTIPDFTKDSEKDFANLKLALDNLLNPYVQLSEKYKYHVLLEHLKLPEAQMIAQSCRHHPEPYTAAVQALQLQYDQH